MKFDMFNTQQVWQPHGTCHISLAPETYTEGGSLLDDVDVQFLALKFVTWDYGKSDQKAAPFLKVDMLPDGTQDVHTEYMKCGELEHWAPSADGETVVGMSDKTKQPGAGINKTSNAAMFLLSLVQAGVPSSKLGSERISDLAGIKCHVVRTKRPKDNIKRAEGAREPQVLTVSKLISTPWNGDVPKAQPLAAMAARTQPSAAQVIADAGKQLQKDVAEINAANGVFSDEDLAMLVLTILGNNGGSMKKLALLGEVHKAAASGAVPVEAKDLDGLPARTTLPKRLFNDAFLGSQPFWRYDGTTVTLQ